MLFEISIYYSAWRLVMHPPIAISVAITLNRYLKIKYKNWHAENVTNKLLVIISLGITMLIFIPNIFEMIYIGDIIALIPIMIASKVVQLSCIVSMIVLNILLVRFIRQKANESSRAQIKWAVPILYPIIAQIKL